MPHFLRSDDETSARKPAMIFEESHLAALMQQTRIQFNERSGSISVRIDADGDAQVINVSGVCSCSEFAQLKTCVHAQVAGAILRLRKTRKERTIQ